jgi:hypothetical protein
VYGAKPYVRACVGPTSTSVRLPIDPALINLPDNPEVKA